MKLGMLLRNSGPSSTAATIATCARAGEELGLDALWTIDHIAIPPDDAEGSGGRYIDPLATLAFAAGITSRIGLGVSVLVLPYRAALPTAKWVASIQELSGGRLTLGVGTGWMAAEFTATGVPREHRGRITDDTLAFLHECFANDVVTLHGQPFIFSPRPARPPILVGGNGAHVLRRVVRHGDGWMPMSGEVEKLRGPIAELGRAMAAAGKPAPQVVPLLQLDLESPDRAAAQLVALSAIGVTGINHTGRYGNEAEFRTAASALVEARQRAGLA
jgi:probable F420-dependent oxidoreductase